MAGRMGDAGSTNGPRITVVGGGAGGLELAIRFGDRLGKHGAAQVILVGRNPTYIWKPLLHEITTDSMNSNTYQLKHATQAHRYGFEFRQDEPKGPGCVAKSIMMSGRVGADGTEVLPKHATSYDTLVLSVGNVTYFFGVPGAAEHTIVLGTVRQAECFRRRFIVACMCAQNDVGDARPQVDIVVVGAGAIGVELPAELRSVAYVLAAYELHKLDPRNDIRIHLIKGGPHTLSVLKKRISAATTELLRKLDIDVIINERATEVTVGTISTASDKLIPAGLTAWAASIRASPALGELRLPVSKPRQVIISYTL